MYSYLKSTASHCEETMLRMVGKVQDVLHCLPDLQDSQMEATILRSCLALPKVSFALRSTPHSHIRNGTNAFDNAMLEAVSDLAGGLLHSWAWMKASLPTSLGALGLRRASLHAPAAYIGSLDIPESWWPESLDMSLGLHDIWCLLSRI